MYCPNCGAGYFDPDENFCHECGTKLSNFQVQKPSMQSNMIQNVQVQQKIADQPLNTPLFQYPSGGIGSKSKRALGFSIASLALLVVSVFIGLGIFAFIIIRSMSMYGYFQYSYGGIWLNLISYVSILNGLGLIFGIVARINASRAKKYETDNAVRKVGGVFSILGIAFNSMAIGLAVIIGPLLIYNLLSMTLGQLFD